MRTCNRERRRIIPHNALTIAALGWEALDLHRPVTACEIRIAVKLHEVVRGAARHLTVAGLIATDALRIGLFADPAIVKGEFDDVRRAVAQRLEWKAGVTDGDAAVCAGGVCAIGVAPLRLVVDATRAIPYVGSRHTVQVVGGVGP